jgi:hypothetical protein
MAHDIRTYQLQYRLVQAFQFFLREGAQTHRQTHRQFGDLIKLLLYAETRESRLGTKVN